MNWRSMVALLGFALISSEAHARPIVVYNLSDGDMSVFDQATLERSPGGGFVWTYGIYGRPAAGGISYMGMRQEVDCARNRYRSVIIRAYDETGKLGGEVVENSDWRLAPPKTGSADLVSAVCDSGYVPVSPFDMDLPEFIRYFRAHLPEPSR